jgi:hypothetical protein
LVWFERVFWPKIEVEIWVVEIIVGIGVDKGISERRKIILQVRVTGGITVEFERRYRLCLGGRR